MTHLFSRIGKKDFPEVSSLGLELLPQIIGTAGNVLHLCQAQVLMDGQGEEIVLQRTRFRIIIPRHPRIISGPALDENAVPIKIVARMPGVLGIYGVGQGADIPGQIVMQWLQLRAVIQALMEKGIVSPTDGDHLCAVRLFQESSGNAGYSPVAPGFRKAIAG